MLLRPHQWVRGRWPWGYGSVLSINIITQCVYDYVQLCLQTLQEVEIKVPSAVSFPIKGKDVVVDFQPKVFAVQFLHPRVSDAMLYFSISKSG